MFGRIQHAAGAQGQGQGNGAANNKAGHNIAGSALRNAGLMDGDAGMRSASSSGRRGGARGASASSSTPAGPSRTHPANDGKARKARDNANPLSARHGRKASSKQSALGTSSSSADPAVRGQAFGIRGLAKKQKPGSSNGPPAAGRVPGGGAQAESTTFNTQGTIAVLRRFLATRWNGASNLLNLSNLKDDDILKQGGVIPPGQPRAHKDIGTVIFKLASELYPNLESISLGNNDFKTLAPIMTLSQYIPNLQNLSLEQNDLKWTKDLAALNSKHGKFTSLRELVLTGNPMQTNAASALNEEGYRAEVIAKFPTLTLLDSVAVSPKESSIAQLPSGKGKPTDQVLGPDVPVRNFPLQVKPGFRDESANEIVAAFLHRFFTLFDSQRDSAELRAAYASNATWTMVVNTAVSARAKAAGYFHSKELPRQRDLNWLHYLKQLTSHNIMGLGTKSPSKGFETGPGEIFRAFKKLPATRHPMTDASKFVVDSWILPNAVVGAYVGSQQGTSAETLDRPDAVLFINVKGEFAEGPSFGVRSFDRTFMVAPAAPNSSAARAGWPCTILTEQMTVKNYAGIDAWREGTLPMEGQAGQQQQQVQVQAQPQSQAQAQVQPQAPIQGAAATPAPTPAPGLNEEQHKMALQFSAETRLTYPFAVQCLAENGWNGQAAMSVFTNLRDAGSIPADAFIQG